MDEKVAKEEKDKAVESLKQTIESFYKNYDVRVDRNVTSEMLKLYGASEFAPAWLKKAAQGSKGDYVALSTSLFKETIFTQPQLLKSGLTAPGKLYKKIKKDRFYILMNEMQDDYNKRVKPTFAAVDSTINKLNRLYLMFMMKAMPERSFYPDANSTLRIAYGKVKPYDPRDGVHYNYFTTLDGIMEKQDSTNEEFIVSPKLKELYSRKEFGEYADKDGTMHVAFIASNHTTGGNSGSPVLDAEGRLIGVNFDRNWEGTMSDIMYDGNRTRNIILDIRYLLFVVDKFAGAGYLLKEMNIQR
jgi:hypothetical protein